MRGADLNDRLVAVAADGEGLGVAGVETIARDTVAQAAAQVKAVQALAGAQRDALWVALSPPADQALPGELLRQLRAAGHGVQGFVDRTALLAAWLDVGGELVALDFSRRQMLVGYATRDSDGAALRRQVPLSGGMQALGDAWLRLAAATLVQQTRFDPLHDGRREAALRAQLPALARQAQRDGQGQCEVDAGDRRVTLALTRDQLATAAQPVLAPLAAALQALSAAQGDAVLVVPDSVLELPGVDAALAGARFARVCRAPDDLAARAASLLPPSGATTEGGVPWRTRIALLPAAAPELLQPLASSGISAQALATHVVYRGRVLPITSAGLVIGRDPGGATTLQLPEGLAGVSRRHCTLRREGQRTQVIDHSSHGTFIDGARVRGRALLPAGGTLRIGDPGIELPLVAIEGG